MEITQKNKLALDLHDSAKSYYERSQEYGYKFLMSLKQIRDEKLFLDLGCSEFEEYTENYFGYSKRTINERIQIAQSWGSDYERALASYGKHKARQLGLLPEIERENLIERGVPTENGVKSIDEATTREIEAYKRQLKEKDEQLSLQAKMIEDLNEQEPQVIEKEVVKEVQVTPPDYHQAIQRSKDLSEHIKAYADRNAFLEDQLSQLSEQRDKANRYQDLEQAIERGKGLLNQQQKEIASTKETIDFIKRGSQFLANFGGVAYLDIQSVLSKNAQLRLEMETFSGQLQILLEDVEGMLQQANNEILEGEIL